MYCPVYGCNSDSQIETSEPVSFFRFPSDKTPEQKRRRAAWTEFCKRKTFKPSPSTRICSLHFAEDAYEPAHSPQFLKSIGFKETTRFRLKNDALPTLNRPAVSFSTSKTAVETTSRKARRLNKMLRRKKLDELLQSSSSSDSDNTADSNPGNSSENAENSIIEPDALPDQDAASFADVSFAASEDMYGPRLRSKHTQTSSRHTNRPSTKTVKTQTYITSKSPCFCPGLFETEVQTEVSKENINKPNAASTRVGQVTNTTPIEHYVMPLEDRSTSTQVTEDNDTPSEQDEPILESVDDMEYSTETQSTESDITTEEDYESEQYVLTLGKPVQKQKKIVIFEDAIIQALGKCKQCDSNCKVAVKHETGSFCCISISCTANMAHSFVWSTGPINNKLPLLNLMLATGIMCTGLESTKVLRLFNLLNIPTIRYRELTNIMKCYVIPAIYRVWKQEQASRIKEIQGKSIVVASDMRVDSPGHSGLFGSGSTMDLSRNIILDTKIIKSTEVKNSNAMELESLKRQIEYLEKNDVKIEKLVTDRHVQVAAYMAHEKPSIEHAYDVWHVAKGEKKKLTKLVKKKKFKSIKPWIGSIINHIYWVGSSSTSEDEREEKWRSILYHIVNIHVHAGHKIFTKCAHDTIERAWLTQGSAAHKMLTQMFTRPRLITAIRKLSQYHQTSGLEAKHSLDNLFASKNTYYSYHALSARLYCSNLHYNENSSRGQAKTKDGKLQWSISYPKAFKGEKVIAKPLKEKPTYGYISQILDDAIMLRSQYPTMKKALHHSKSILPPEPSSLVQKYTAGKERPQRDDVIAKHHTRYSKPALLPDKDNTQSFSCSCKGKCATKACPCKYSRRCDTTCGCSEAKCTNREK